MNQELLLNAILSHYRIVAKIGAGGTGNIYLAEDARLSRKVALKVLPDAIAQDKDRRRRFEREARAASSLNHPNILTIHEFGHGYFYGILASTMKNAAAKQLSAA